MPKARADAMSLNAITGGLDVPPGDNSVVAPLSCFSPVVYRERAFCAHASEKMLDSA
jgi:hypothetical protein